MKESEKQVEEQEVQGLKVVKEEMVEMVCVEGEKG